VVLSTWPGNFSVVAVAGRLRPRRLEHEDRAAGRGGLVLTALRYDEGVVLGQLDGGLGAVGGALGDVEAAVEDEEELVRVLVDVPDVPDVRTCRTCSPAVCAIRTS
jgi:hypothetical protein